MILLRAKARHLARVLMQSHSDCLQSNLTENKLQVFDASRAASTSFEAGASILMRTWMHPVSGHLLLTSLLVGNNNMSIVQPPYRPPTRPPPLAPPTRPAQPPARTHQRTSTQTRTRKHMHTCSAPPTISAGSRYKINCQVAFLALLPGICHAYHDIAALKRAVVESQRLLRLRRALSNSAPELITT